MRRLIGGLVTAVVLTIILYFALAGARVEAQIDPGNFELYQGGVKVGEIFVPFRDRTAKNYVEHWVLYPSYANPADGRGSTEIRPVARRYLSASEFFHDVPFAPGARYVLVRAQESLDLPKR